jgi:serine/threonine protein kinase
LGVKKSAGCCYLDPAAVQEGDVMQESDPSTCPTCHLPIAADAPGGLCPACALVGAAAVPPTSAGGPHSPPPSVAEIAPHFPELEILELLGAGGMGAVYKVRQPQLDRTVALKLLSRQLAQDPAFVERFNREAKVLARLSHPNIVAVFDFGTAGPYCYLLMEYVDGVNLRQAMRTGGFTPAEALTLIQDVCAALQFAHEEGILHRDIKPENILIDAKGRVKIADFGIAKLVGGGAAADVTLTLQGSILGSPHYMAPEQIETPGDVDQRADIYSLGVVLYEMLTGELPIGRFALPSEKAAMDARIDDIVLRTLAKERELRYQTVDELKTGFEGIGNPAAPSQTAFINQQLLMIAKYTFRIAMILLAILFFDIALVGGTDSLLVSAHYFPYLAGAAVLLSSISVVIREIHAARTRGLQPDRNGTRPESAHLPIRQNQKTGHLGLTAAILTGISLTLAAAWAMINVSVNASRIPGQDSYIITGTPMFLLGLPAAIAAVTGFILGASALATIRKSGGTKDGLGSAIFAVVTWPIGLMAVLVLFSLAMPMPGGAGGGIPTSLALLFVGLPLLLAGFILVRGLSRWALGVEAENSRKSFPGLTGTLLGALGLAILGPVLAAVVPGLVGTSELHDGLGGRHLETRVTSTGMETGDEVSWHRGAPESLLPFIINPTFGAEFRLALCDGDGKPQKYSDIGAWIPTKSRSAGSAETLLKIGSTKPLADSPDQHGVTVVLVGTGAIGELHADTDFAEWNFKHWEGPVAGPPVDTKSESLTIATLAETIGGEERIARQLRLEIRYFEQ